MLMMVWVIYVVYNGQFTRMDQLFKLLKWLQTLQDFLWKYEDPGGYELFSFFAHVWNFHLASHKNVQMPPCNTFLSPSPAIKGSAALTVF